MELGLKGHYFPELYYERAPRQDVFLKRTEAKIFSESYLIGKTRAGDSINLAYI